MSSIGEFEGKDIPESYYPKLVKELEPINKRLNAFLTISNPEGGFPFSVKDNICVNGVESRAGSRILKGYIPPFNATAVERMLNSGFGFLGKTNMDEFGFGSFGLNTEVPAKNPFDERYVAGGSSSGAAVATSILKYHVAISESTGGSIATPAAFCGVVGFTPTYGAVSRYGLIDYANSLDKIGVMARSAEDVRIVFDKVKGSDKYDTTCTDAKFTAKDKKKVFIIDQFTKGVDEKILSSFEKLVEKFKDMGYNVENREIRLAEKAIAAYYIIAMAESSTNLAKYTGFKYGLRNERFDEHYNEFFTKARKAFHKESKRRIVLGTMVRSASVRDRYYSKALKVRSLLLDEMNALLKEGFILSPVMPILTPKMAEAESLTPLEMYKSDMLTIPANLCGLPHISFPYAYEKGMPLGAQLITSQFNDYAIMDMVSKWEKDFEYRFKYNLGEL